MHTLITITKITSRHLDVDQNHIFQIRMHRCSPFSGFKLKTNMMTGKGSRKIYQGQYLPILDARRPPKSVIREVMQYHRAQIRRGCSLLNISNDSTFGKHRSDPRETSPWSAIYCAFASAIWDPVLGFPPALYLTAPAGTASKVCTVQCHCPTRAPMHAGGDAQHVPFNEY